MRKDQKLFMKNGVVEKKIWDLNKELEEDLIEYKCKYMFDEFTLFFSEKWYGNDCSHCKKLLFYV